MRARTVGDVLMFFIVRAGAAHAGEDGGAGQMAGEDGGQLNLVSCRCQACGPRGRGRWDERHIVARRRLVRTT